MAPESNRQLSPQCVHFPNPLCMVLEGSSLPPKAVLRIETLSLVMEKQGSDRSRFRAGSEIHSDCPAERGWGWGARPSGMEVVRGHSGTCLDWPERVLSRCLLTARALGNCGLTPHSFPGLIPAGCLQALEFIAPRVNFGGFGTLAGGERANDIEDSTKE